MAEKKGCKVVVGILSAGSIRRPEGWAPASSVLSPIILLFQVSLTNEPRSSDRRRSSPIDQRRQQQRHRPAFATRRRPTAHSTRVYSFLADVVVLLGGLVR